MARGTTCAFRERGPHFAAQPLLASFTLWTSSLTSLSLSLIFKMYVCTSRLQLSAEEVTTLSCYIC